jgi:hypothetical protein
MTDESLIAAPAETAVPATPPVEAAPVVAAAPARPEGLPDTYWDDAAGVKPEAYSRLAELEAADAARRAGVPESADKYELKVADTIVGLDGKPIQFDAADPLVAGILPVLGSRAPSDADGSMPIDYGLIAEEVAEVYPDLVTYTNDGQVETVQYNKVNAMLLNEVQRQQREIGELKARLAALERLLATDKR